MTSALQLHDQDQTEGTTVRLMGGFSVLDGGLPVTLPGDAQRLIAFLALQRARVPRAYAAGTLWIDGNQERAFGNLRSALWRVRRGADGLIDADAQSLGIVEGIAVDADVLVRSGTRICSNEPQPPGNDHDQELFSRELLPGWYDEWVVVEREQLRQVSLHALESIANRLREQQLFAAAIQAALAAIRLDPLRESAHRCLIRIHLAEGNYSEAIRHYGEYSERLMADLGIEASPQLRAALPIRVLA